MKRKAAIAFFVLLSVAVMFTSCSRPAKSSVWYAYFGDCSVMFAFNGKTNTLYEVFLPTETIALWGKENNISLMTEAIERFVDRAPVSFFTGTPDTHESLRIILESIGSDGTHCGNLNTMVRNAEVLSKQPLSGRISRLCGTSYADLARIVLHSEPDIECIEADSFLHGNSVSAEREYFVRWVHQILD